METLRRSIQSRSAPGEDTLTQPFRIATFNLETLGDVRAGAIPLAQRIAALRPRLVALKADVLCLQEVDAQEIGPHRRGLSALEQLLQDTIYAGYHRVAGETEPGHGPADRHNLVVLSRWPIRASRSVMHDKVAPPAGQADMQSRWDRPILQAEIALPTGRALHVLNLHLRAPLATFVPKAKEHGVWQSTRKWAQGFHLATLKRIGQALEARLIVDDLLDADREALIVVAGDLNADLHEMPLRLLCAASADTNNAALGWRALEPAERRMPEQQRYTVIFDGRRVVLDHLLLSQRLAAALQSVEAKNEGLADEVVAQATSRREPGSFHAALVAAVEI
jgi:endonuclease/exonuclease/phosphatase family metal-dependent hydrolase